MFWRYAFVACEKAIAAKSGWIPCNCRVIMQLQQRFS
jgi:hypothetical protein